MSNRDIWTTTTSVLILAFRNGGLLLGKPREGVVAGFLTPLGGRMDPEKDIDLEACVHRQLWESARLRSWRELDRVGHITVNIRGTLRRNDLHIYRPKGPIDEGRLIRDAEKHEYLRFLRRVPWNRVPPRDDIWLKHLLGGGDPVEMEIHCGDSRIQVTSVSDLRRLKSSG